MTESLRTDLNDFLFTPIANDSNGMHLTVLSALARSGVDPWDEATRLAALTRESATLNIVEMLSHVPNGPSPGDQTDSMAARLVAQLHSPSTPALKPVTAIVTTTRGERSPQSSYSAPAARVRSILYVLAILIVTAIVYGALVGNPG